ncbi:protein-disulfide isomerase [Mycolicibacterium sp. BK556]|uniref:DsbA family protein n=1 Tax=unclassified Mycolicibacterium TaxID=2636767 RepID=UPI00160DC899|nr:protein-disulfide isomerase [Mycolicibacterium sp. BK556]MBB3634460.1 protein-disulfide isomerase [Mycolicibacterium sp. BK607]MBB3752037.1 protein-disulfide isomerase [Mycolicibacterium sp. BK634]
MATNKKSTPKYDLKAQDRKRNLFIQLGLTAIVVVFAVALVLYIVMGHDKNKGNGNAQAVRIASSQLIKKDGSDEPKAVLSLYEDFQCPHCREFEKVFGPTITKLTDSGAVATDYYMVAILNSPINKNYSTRAANAAYCVADENKDAFLRFHGALFAQQPEEGSGAAPDNNSLIETARQAGAAGGVPQCINSGKHSDMVEGLAAAAKISATPTIRLNGQDISPASPEDLIAKVKAIVGNVPGLDAAPTPGAPAPAAAPAAPAAPAPAAPAAPAPAAPAPATPTP